MRIACSYCGPRGNEEFNYLGDATVVRPGGPTPSPGVSALSPDSGRGSDPLPNAVDTSERRGQPPDPGAAALTKHLGTGSDPVAPDPVAPDPAAWHDYVYLRDNPAGSHRELWQHVAGCRAWLVLTRDTRTHDILGVEPARDVALSRAGQTP